MALTLVVLGFRSIRPAALSFEDPAPASLAGYLLPGKADDKIVVRAMLGLEGQVIASSVEETVDQVAVSVYQRSVKGEMPGAGVLIDVEVLLREPIGDRTVVDALSGSELRVVRW